MAAKEEMLNVWDVLYHRRSIRRFERGKPLPAEIKGKILDSIRYAPPGGTGEYPWKIMVIDDQKIKDMIADCGQEVSRKTFGASYEQFSSHLWYLPEETRLRVAEYTTSGELWRYPEDCSMLTIPLLRASEIGFGHGGINNVPKLTAGYLGLAAENMWLVARVFGIGAGYNMMPLNDIRRTEIIASELGVPHSWTLCGAYAFGYPSTGRAAGPSRGPMEGMAFSESWGNIWDRVAFRNEGEGIKFPDVSIFDCIRNLKQMRSFKPGKVEDWMIERMLDAGFWGPNPENSKHVRYLVVQDEASKEFIYRAAHERGHTTLCLNDAEVNMSRFSYLGKEKALAQAEKEFITGPGEWYRTAGAIIIVLDSNRFNYIYSAVSGESPITQLSTGCCVQNVLLAGVGLGLGVNYDTLPICDHRAVQPFRDFFNIPFDWDPVALIAVGKPGEPMALPPPPPLESLVYDEYWGNAYKGRKYQI